MATIDSTVPVPGSRGLPPGPRSLNPFQSLDRLRRDPIGFFADNAARYGDIVRFRLGFRTGFQVNHPELVRDLLITDSLHHHRGPLLQRAQVVLGKGLLTSEEPLHAQQRKIIQPAFHRDRILQYGEFMLACAQRQSGAWREGQIIDLHAETARLTLAVVGSALFGTGFEAESGEITAVTTEFMSLIGLVMLPFSKLVMKLPLNAVRRFRRAQASFDEIVLAMIRERMKSGEDRGDLLSTLLAAQQSEGGGEDVARQVRDECVNLILAGHETVSNALTYTVLFLARRPDVAKRIRDEIAQVAGDAPLAARHFEKLVFTRAVLAESMRLFPPAWALARTVTSEYSIRGYRIKKGAIVFTCTYVMHRDPRFFPEPLEFRPERFLAPSHPRFAYFPFGAGPRQCIGEGFAWMEGVLVLATLMRSWNFEPQFKGDPPLYPSVTLRPLHAVPVRLTKNV